MKNIKGIFSAVIVVIIAIGLAGCTTDKDKLTMDNYNDMKKNITLGCGKTVLELEAYSQTFVNNVYAPKSQDSIQKGIDQFKDIMTDDEYKTISSQIGSYDKSVKQTISNINTHYGPAEHMSDGMPRLYIQFTVTGEKYSQNKSIEFVFNPNNKIFKHYLWTGPMINK